METTRSAVVGSAASMLPSLTWHPVRVHRRRSLLVSPRQHLGYLVAFVLRACRYLLSWDQCFPERLTRLPAWHGKLLGLRHAWQHYGV